MNDIQLVLELEHWKFWAQVWRTFAFVQLGITFAMLAALAWM